MTKRETSTVVPAFGLLLLAISLSYIGGYLTLVKKIKFRNSAEFRTFDNVEYRCGGDEIAMFFDPIHKLDRQLRPAYCSGSDIEMAIREALMEMKRGPKDIMILGE